MSPKVKSIAQYLDHPFVFLLAITAGVWALTALSVWGLKSWGKMPGLLAFIQGGRS